MQSNHRRAMAIVAAGPSPQAAPCSPARRHAAVALVAGLVGASVGLAAAYLGAVGGEAGAGPTQPAPTGTETAARSAPAVACLALPQSVADAAPSDVRTIRRPAASAVGGPGMHAEGVFDAADVARLIVDTRANPALREGILSRFTREKDAAARAALGTIISSFPAEEAAQMANRLMRGGANERTAAFRLLGASPSAAALSLPTIEQALQTERDAQVLGAAVDALGSQPAMDPAQAQATVQRLDALATTADPALRADSLRALAAWDRNGDVAEPRLHEALLGSDSTLRAAALGAIISTSVRSPRLKEALLGIASDSASSAMVRADARYALARFSLTPAEYATYMQSLRLPSAGAESPSTGGADLPPADPGGAGLSPFGR